MRSASERGYGPANLRDARSSAVAPALRDAGVVVSWQLDRGGGRRHQDPYLVVETFRSLNLGPLGRWIETRSSSSGIGPAGAGVAATTAAERVHLIKAHVAMDGSLLDGGLAAGADGFVVSHRAGNTSPALLEAATRAIEAGLPVAPTTRAPAGRASAAYAFPGGGATWVRAGAMLTGYLGGPKARIVLALGIGAGLDRGALAALLADPEPRS